MIYEYDEAEVVTQKRIRGIKIVDVFEKASTERVILNDTIEKLLRKYWWIFLIEMILIVILVGLIVKWQMSRAKKKAKAGISLTVGDRKYKVSVSF